MRKNIYNFLLTCFLVIPILLTSCKTDKVKSNTELLCNANWKLSAFTINPGVIIGGVTITDYFTQFPPCVLDNIYQYKSNGQSITDEGPSKCSEFDSQSTAGTWVFNTDETKITEDNTDTYDILQLDDDIFIISSITDGADIIGIGGIPGVKYKITQSYKH